MGKNTLLKTLLIVSIVMTLIAIGWTWLEIMHYWEPPSGGVAAAQHSSPRVTLVSNPKGPAQS